MMILICWILLKLTNKYLRNLKLNLASNMGFFKPKGVKNLPSSLGIFSDILHGLLNCAATTNTTYYEIINTYQIYYKAYSIYERLFSSLTKSRSEKMFVFNFVSQTCKINASLLIQLNLPITTIPASTSSPI